MFYILGIFSLVIFKTRVFLGQIKKEGNFMFPDSRN